MNNSYLVARNIENGDIRIFLINESWYLGQYGSEVHLNNSLGAIDVVTSKFNSFKEMNEKLFRLKIDDYEKYDAFACTFDKDGNALFDELIFSSSSSNKYKTELLRRIALANMAGEVQTEEKAIQEIVGDFLLTAYSAVDFYDIVTSFESGVDGKIIDICKEIVLLDDFGGEVDIDDDIVNDYRNIRNMLEALYRVSSLSYGKDDRIALNYENYVKKNEDRKKVVKAISRTVINPYMNEIISASDNASVKKGDSSNNYERMIRARRLKNRLDKEREKKDMFQTQDSQKSVVKKQESKIESSRLSYAEKRKEVKRVLDTLPIDIFYKEKSSGKWIFNKNVFDREISEEDYKKLNSLLTGNMPLYFLKYAFSKQEYRGAQDRGFNLLEYREEVEHNMRTIETRFKSLKCLDNTYKWCMIFEKYKTMGDQDSLERGKIFEK